jgi:hypothetical protein
MGLLGKTARAGSGLLDELIKLLAKGKAEGSIVEYPDELIESTPFELRKAIADHNESILGPEYRESFDEKTFYRGGGSERSALKDDVWMSSDPYQASTYAGKVGGNVMPLKVRKEGIPEVYSNSPEWNRIGLLDSSMKIPSNEYPEELGRVMFNSEQSPYAVTDTNMIAQFAKDEGFGGVGIKGLQDIGPYQRGSDLSKVRRAESLVLADGSNARSVNAAFDPAKEGSRNLLASRPEAAIASLLGLAAMTSSDDADAGVLGKAKGLLMDTPSRMSRAKEQGINTEAPLYHGTNENFDEFVKPDINRMAERAEAGFWLTPDKAEASKYGKNLKEIYTKTDKLYPISERDLDFIASSEPIGAWVSARKAEGYEGLKIAEKKADRVMETPYQAEQVVIFDPSNMRSSDAAFDPAKTGSSNLLASNPAATTGAGILGLGAAAQSNDTYADYSPSNLARLQSDDVGSIEAPQSMAAANIAGLMGNVNKVGYDDPLLGMVASQLPSELMNKIAYNDKRGLLDYAKAYAGLLGF